MKIRVGSAPDSWGIWFPEDPKQMPWERFLDEIAEAGYDYTELGPYGYLPTHAQQLRRELEARRLSVCGGFVMARLDDPEYWPEVERQTLGAGEVLTALGGEYLVLIDDTYSDPWTGKLLEPASLEPAQWAVLGANAMRVAKLAQEEFGLTLVFHPHAETHIEYEAQIERLLRETDPALVSLCLDIGHHAYRGGEPISFFREHHRRIPYLHLKNVDPVVQRRVKDENIPFAHAVGASIFCEPWRGAVDYEAFRDVLKEVDYAGFAVVEQDMYPAPFDKPLPIAKKTRAYLKEIGIG